MSLSQILIRKKSTSVLDVSASSIRQQLIERGRKSKHPDDAGLRKMADYAAAMPFPGFTRQDIEALLVNDVRKELNLL